MEYAASRCKQWPVVARRWEGEFHTDTDVRKRLLHSLERQRSHAGKNADRERRPCCQYGRFPVGFYSIAPPPLGRRAYQPLFCVSWLAVPTLLKSISICGIGKSMARVLKYACACL